jgi:hypothetical protein
MFGFEHIRFAGIVFCALLACGACAGPPSETGTQAPVRSPEAGLAPGPALPGGGAAAAQAMPESGEARALLKSMSDYVGGQQTIELTFDSDIEVITPQLEKIQFASSGEMMLNRPDKLRARRVGGYSDVELVFDGKRVGIHGRSVNGFAQFDAPGDLDGLFHALREGHGVALPAADFLLANSYDVLVAGVQESKYLGRGVIDGRECEHLAFRNFDTDWQLWLEAGPRPIPRKVVITSKTVNGAPQYTIRIKSWKTGVKPARNAFEFVPPAGATRLNPDQLIELDELPPDATAGGTP